MPCPPHRFPDPLSHGAAFPPPPLPSPPAPAGREASSPPPAPRGGPSSPAPPPRPAWRPTPPPAPPRWAGRGAFYPGLRDESGGRSELVLSLPKETGLGLASRGAAGGGRPPPPP